MRNSIIYAMAVSALTAMSLSSCVKKEIYKTPHPDKSAVMLVPDWAEAPSGTDVPQKWSYTVDDGDVFHSENTTQCHPELLLPGKHDILVYNEPQGIMIYGTTAVINSVSEGLLIAEPEYLYSAITEFDAAMDDTVSVSIPMKRLLTLLTLNVSLDGENADKVADVKASLSGVPGSVDLRTWVTDEIPQSVLLEVEQRETVSRAGVSKELVMKCRILGINPTENQILTTTLVNDDGYESTVISDLTEELKSINEDKEPVKLEGSVFAAQDGHFSGTIDNWEVVSAGDVEAN